VPSGGEQRKLEAIHTSVADVFAEPDGTVVLRFLQGSHVTAQATLAVVHAQIAAAQGGKRPTLADVRGIAINDRAARELAAGPEIVAVTSRMAVLVGNPVSRILGNFFLRVTRPAYPARLFTDEASARRWLSEAFEP
jgi:hypothetical protein